MKGLRLFHLTSWGGSGSCMLSLPVTAGWQWCCFLITLNSSLISVKTGMDRLQGFFFPAHLLLCFSPSKPLELSGSGLLWYKKKSCLLTLPSAENKNKNTVLLRVCLCVVCYSFVFCYSHGVKGSKTLWVVISLWTTFSTKNTATSNKDLGLSPQLSLSLLGLHQQTWDDWSIVMLPINLLD